MRRQQRTLHPPFTLCGTIEDGRLYSSVAQAEADHAAGVLSDASMEAIRGMFAAPTHVVLEPS